MMDSAWERRLQKLAEPSQEMMVDDDEVEALNQGKKVAVQEDDDHVVHLRQHMRMKQMMQGRVMRGMMGADKLHNLESHVKAHRDAQKAVKALRVGQIP